MSDATSTDDIYAIGVERVEPEPVEHPTTPALLERIKYLARTALPRVGSVHRCEALAAGMGCASFATLLHKLSCRPSGLDTGFKLDRFNARMVELGYPAATLQGLHDFYLDVNDVLQDWKDGRYESLSEGGLMAVLEMGTLREKRRHAAALLDLERNGMLPAGNPALSHDGNSRVEWTLDWSSPAQDGTVMAALRLAVPDSYLMPNATFGWGQPQPYRGVTIHARAVLAALSGDWLAGCLEPWNRPAFHYTFNERIERAGFGQLAQALSPIHILVDQQGLHIGDGHNRFSPGAEAVLSVLGLARLGDCLAQRILSTGHNRADMVAAHEWVAGRAHDGLPPVLVHQGPCLGLAHERARAAWIAARIGIDLELYLKAALFSKAANAFSDAAQTWHNGFYAEEALPLAKQGGLPDQEGINRLVQAAMAVQAWQNLPSAGVRGVAGEGAYDIDAWTTWALMGLNTRAWYMCYSTCWTERRAQKVDELTGDYVTTAVQAWADRLNAALLDGAALDRDWCAGEVKDAARSAL